MHNGVNRSVAFAYDSDKQLNRLDHPKNCLNTIRLIAAISVLYIHAKVHLGADMPAILTRIIAFFQGVPIFFAMSGFLIWDSVGRSDRFFSYAKNVFCGSIPSFGVLCSWDLL